MNATATRQHTATPWKIAGQGDGNQILPILAGGNRIGGISHDGSLADAAFIVQAVNAHDELVAACERLVAIESGPGQCSYCGDFVCGTGCPVRMAILALSKARGD